MSDFLSIGYDENNNKVFRYNFPSLYALVNFLKTAPVNRKSFSSSLASEATSPHKMDFAGEPLEDALEHVLYGYNLDYKRIKETANFNELIFDVDTEPQRSRTYRSYSGSRVDIPAYVNGSPKNMRRLKRYEEIKMIDFYFQLSYTSQETEKQIINRGLIALHLIKSLEQMGYQVNLKAFSLDWENITPTSKEMEIVYTTIKLKDFGLPLNESKCVGPFVRKEFLRRIIFRLLEVTDVSSCWKLSYGRPFKEDDTKRMLSLKENDIFFGQAHELGIMGNDIYDDYQSVISKLNLEEGISLTKRLK